MTFVASDTTVDDARTQFQLAIKKYFNVKTKSKKSRPKKQPRLENSPSPLLSQDLETISKCIVYLQQPLNYEPLQVETVVEVLRATLLCLEDLYEYAPLAGLLPKHPNENMEAGKQVNELIATAEKHPVYMVLLGVVRRCVNVACCSLGIDDCFPRSMHVLVEWTRESPDSAWLLAFTSKVAPQAVTAFSLRLLCEGELNPEDILLSNLDAYLAAMSPSKIATSIRAFLHETIASKTPHSIASLIEICSYSPRVVRACDSEFQNIFSSELVSSLIILGLQSNIDFQTKLSKLLRDQLEAMIEMPIHVIALMDRLLMDVPEVAECTTKYLSSLVKWIRNDESGLFSDRLLPALPYIQKKNPSSKVASQLVEAIAASVASNADRTQMACQALMILDDKDNISHSSFTSTVPSAAVCVDYLASELRVPNTTPLQNQKALSLLRNIVVQNLSQEHDAGNTAAECWKSLEAVNKACAVDQWPMLLNFADSSDQSVSLSALQLLIDIPYPLFEDPSWQYTCLHNLTSLFFSLLNKIADKNERTSQQLECVKRIFDRIMQEGGGVVSNPMSVESTFLSLFMDGILSASSPTTIPHDVPFEMNFFRGKSTKAGSSNSQVFRKLSATNCLLPYDPFPTKKLPVESSSQLDVFSQVQLIRSTQPPHALPAPSQFESKLYSVRVSEMETAINCSQHAEDLLYRSLRLGTFESSETSSVLMDILLERTIPVSVFVPSDDQYRDLLPERSNFDIDLRIEQWLYRYPIFLPLVKSAVLSSSPSVSVRCLPLLKSILVVLINHWHAQRFQPNTIQQEKNLHFPPYFQLSHQLQLSTEVMTILELSGWLPEPLNLCALLFPHVTALDVRTLLHSVWMYLADHPPNKKFSTKEPIAMENYLIPLQNVVHRNIQTIGPLYGYFA
ncbi:hypothetical protein Ae201684_016481 [Aphanomyces euteiches]|uniref:Integrator complex subunit 5 C-terminal domain-containing protein n=1 Tax=Aphanomyces euteiches TaxID=100861 RepID=A0A6G0WCC6_9STRA|nr:hypothetical protein Ae201684_016481 [Aphanomyces euteiches]KAH9134190.1 hypothetical protein AeRB84_019968 [Aphanomyces euteiches]